MNKRVARQTNHPLLLFLCVVLSSPVFGQVEIEPWGNLRGIRVNGQLMEVQSSIAVAKDWSHITATAKEMQRPKYVRKGGQQIITTNIDSLYFTVTVEDAGTGKASLNVEMMAREAAAVAGVYLRLVLPYKYFAKGSGQLDDTKRWNLFAADGKLLSYPERPTRSIAFRSAQRQVAFNFGEPTAVIIRPSPKGRDLEIFIPIKTGSIPKDEATAKRVSIQTSGTVDNTPVTVTVNTTAAGRQFDGLGGNFRLQNPRTDPQVIDYSLANLRVAWSRVEMPWRFWQPKKGDNPLDSARAGRLHPAVRNAMEMAQRLSKMGIPVILSAWSGPGWAIVGPPRFRPGPDGVWGNPLNADSTQDIYRSIADYISFLKEGYGVEVAMFSFNESDLGINIRQTGAEHATLIKGLGAYLESRGLKTKMLLGDNSDATTYEFIYPAMNDPATHKYIGAVSFHSWRGWETSTLQRWADAATKLARPLLVGEGSIDAQAWGYPMIFLEPTYALEEINLYTRMLNICQPASILQWQLTADYSPMAGGGIFGDTSPLRPTQRFWNLKQLASTPAGLKAMPVNYHSADISCAALGDNSKGQYALHFVNNGPARQVTIKGLPKNVKQLQMFITDAKRSMRNGKAVAVANGQVTFTLDATSYVTLMN
ncbi:MAG TPA: hypothetical protein VER36_09170 [Flavisolibacter sp.]|nr:hypothetical protein [Flavisolibacter sp.]